MLPVHRTLLFVMIFAGLFTHSCCAQDLAPWAYFIAPLRSNAITLTEAFFHGSVTPA